MVAKWPPSTKGPRTSCCPCCLFIRGWVAVQCASTIAQRSSSDKVNQVMTRLGLPSSSCLFGHYVIMSSCFYPLRWKAQLLLEHNLNTLYKVCLRFRSSIILDMVGVSTFCSFAFHCLRNDHGRRMLVSSPLALAGHQRNISSAAANLGLGRPGLMLTLLTSSNLLTLVMVENWCKIRTKRPNNWNYKLVQFFFWFWRNCPGCGTFITWYHLN